MSRLAEDDDGNGGDVATINVADLGVAQRLMEGAAPFTSTQQQSRKFCNEGIGLQNGVSKPGGPRYSPSASMTFSAVSVPEKFCCPVIRFPSRTANPRHNPAWT